jgi:hypothetical protein
MNRQGSHERPVISETLLNNYRYGIYLLSDLEPETETYIAGGLKSVDEAKAWAKELAVNKEFKEISGIFDSIEYRPRPKVSLGLSPALAKEEDLAESLRLHLDRATEQITKLKFPRSLFSYQSSIFYLTVLALWLFWSKGSIGIPKGLDLPLVGNRLDGIVLDAPTLARYLPIALFALYGGKFLSLLKTNMEYDTLRQRILALIIYHQWRADKFLGVLLHSRKSAEKSGLGWLLSLSEWLYDNSPNTFASMRRPSKERPSGSGGKNAAELSPTPQKSEEAIDPRVELDQLLPGWLDKEFERRVHALYFLDKEKDYSRFVICFNPLLYICSLNRVLLYTYDFLSARGENLSHERPTDVHAMERFAVPGFWAGAAFNLLFLGGVMIWAIFLARDMPRMLLATNIVAATVVIALPTWWNFLAMAKHRGYPRGEPLGAYLVGALTPNRLSLL